MALGCAARWDQRVYANFPVPRVQRVVVPTPNMTAFARQLFGGVSFLSGHAVTRLQSRPEGWSCTSRTCDALAEVRMVPCWTLMAATDELDWPWDAALVETGELAWIWRDDRAPGRSAAAGRLPWVAHATAEWSLEPLDDDPAAVCEVLRTALGKLLTGSHPARMHHAAVHLWRCAQVVQRAPGELDCWWSGGRGLGVCGDAFGDGSVEAAWRSGDELTDAVAAPAELADSAH